MAMVLPRSGAEAADKPDTLPPVWWPTHPSKLGDGPLDLMSQGAGEAADGKRSEHFHYPDAVFSDAISMRSRECLHACWTSTEKVREILATDIDIHTANQNGFTGLHFAAQKFRLEIAE